MFKKRLEEMMERADGSIGALIMGTDGISVEKALKDEGQEANLDVAAAEFTSLVRNAQRTGNELGMGALNELVVAMESCSVIMRLLNKEYFILLALGPEGNL